MSFLSATIVLTMTLVLVPPEDNDKLSNNIIGSWQSIYFSVNTDYPLDLSIWKYYYKDGTVIMIEGYDGIKHVFIGKYICYGDIIIEPDVYGEELRMWVANYNGDRLKLRNLYYNSTYTFNRQTKMDVTIEVLPNNPSNLDEAVKVLCIVLPSYILDGIALCKEDDAMLKYYYLTSYIQHAFGLTSYSALDRYFKVRGIDSADYESEIILRSLWRYLNRRPIGENRQIFDVIISNLPWYIFPNSAKEAEVLYHIYIKIRYIMICVHIKVKIILLYMSPGLIYDNIIYISFLLIQLR